MWERYLSAYNRGKQEGFTPVFIPVDDTLTDQFQLNYEDNGDTYRKSLLSAELTDGKTYLDNRFADFIKENKELDCEFDENEIYGEFSGGETQLQPYALENCKDHKKWILAEIPTKNPWEVFAWITFGGWNECPDDREIMCAVKYWYEEYNAVPAVITHDILELYVPVIIENRITALEIAEQQYGFCPDIVDQGCGSINRLADSLAKSTIWFFWWD